MRAGRLDPLPLVSHVIDAHDAANAYALLDSPPDNLLQVILDFRGGNRRMNQTVRLAVQEQYLRGATMIEKWEHAQALGFDAIELRGAGRGPIRRPAARTPAGGRGGRADADGVRRDAAFRRRFRLRRSGATPLSR